MTDETEQQSIWNHATIADYVAHNYKDLRCSEETGQWYHYDKCWQKVSKDRAKYLIQQYCITNNDEIFDGIVEAIVSKDRECNAVFSQCKGRMCHKLPPQDDCDYFSFEDGLFNLKTLKIEPHNPDIWLTTTFPYSLKGSKKRDNWTAFYNSIQREDDMREWLQMVMGSCLSGHKFSRDFYYIKGETMTGKSTFISTICSVLGGYGRKVRSSVFSKSEKSRFKSSGLQGKRLVYADEFPERHVDEEYLKELTGDTKTEIERKGVDSEEITIQCKLFIASNNEPHGNYHDSALWSRMKIVEFKHKFVSDHDPREDFEDEYNGIFLWLLEGYIKMRKFNKDLTPPASVQSAVLENRTDNDPLNAFKEECLVFTTESMDRIPYAELNQSIKNWFYKNEGEYPAWLTPNVIKRSLEISGAAKTKFKADGKMTRGYKWVKWNEDMIKAEQKERMRGAK